MIIINIWFPLLLIFSDFWFNKLLNINELIGNQKIVVLNLWVYVFIEFIQLLQVTSFIKMVEFDVTN